MAEHAAPKLRPALVIVGAQTWAGGGCRVNRLCVCGFPNCPGDQPLKRWTRQWKDIVLAPRRMTNG